VPVNPDRICSVGKPRREILPPPVISIVGNETKGKEFLQLLDPAKTFFQKVRGGGQLVTGDGPFSKR